MKNSWKFHVRGTDIPLAELGIVLNASSKCTARAPRAFCLAICPHSLAWIGLQNVLNCSMIHDPMIQATSTLQLSGLVFFGTSEMMVGLADSQWLRIPLAAFPELQSLSEDEWLDYRLAANRTQLRWPGRDISLSVSDLAAKAISIDDGDKGPN